MPKTPFQAAAEGLPTRRQFLRSAFAASAVVAAGVPALASEPVFESGMTDTEFQRFARAFDRLDGEGKRLIRELIDALLCRNNALSHEERKFADAWIAEVEGQIRGRS